MASDLPFANGFVGRLQKQLQERGSQQGGDDDHERDAAEEAGVEDVRSESGLGEDQPDLAARTMPTPITVLLPRNQNGA